MQVPKVSFIVTVYNKAPFLGELIESIVAQAVFPSEVVFSDDASTDVSLAVLLEYQSRLSRDDFVIKVVQSERNQGPSAALNAAVKLATGEYFHFVDADDVLPHGATATMIGICQRHGVGLVYGGKQRLPTAMAPDLVLSAFRVHRPALDALVRLRLVGMRFLAKREFAETGADIRIFTQDVSLPLRIAHASEGIAVIDAPVVNVRDTPNSLSKRGQQELADFIGAIAFFLNDFSVGRRVRARLLRRGLGRLRRNGRRSYLLWEVVCSLGFAPSTAHRALLNEFAVFHADRLVRAGPAYCGNPKVTLAPPCEQAADK